MTVEGKGGAVGVESGLGVNFKPFDADEFREFQRSRDRGRRDKTTTAREAIAKYVIDGCYIGTGGFGTNRISTALIHEILRQRKRKLCFAGHTATHDCQILTAGGCVDRCDAAYIVGLEARGLSPVARRAFQSGEVRAVEWTNAAIAWRYKAAAMGVPFLPVRIMAGTDTFKYSAAKTMDCPFTGQKVVLVPALAPDVALIHVHRADVTGNCEIEGIIVADTDLAKASRYVVISCEEIVDEEYFRLYPNRNHIPWFCVDAVVEIPYGSYPCNMPGMYFTDEPHLAEWLKAEEDPVGFKEFLRKHVYDVKDFYEYIELCGGLRRLYELRREEKLTPGKPGIEGIRGGAR